MGEPSAHYRPRWDLAPEQRRSALAAAWRFVLDEFGEGQRADPTTDEPARSENHEKSIEEVPADASTSRG